MNEAQFIHLPPSSSTEEFYHHLLVQAKALIATETDLIANCANAASLLYYTLSEVNWCGFYFLRGDELVLGPFQGKPACVRIALGKGVCGSAAEQQQTLVVTDVEQFPGHIACDAASRSEIVVPLVFDDTLIGVLDIDSPQVARFSTIDAEYLEKLAHAIVFASSEMFNQETL